MDSNFEALFTHFKPTDDQIKALLLDLWRKNEEKQKKIDKMSLSNDKLMEKMERLLLDEEIVCSACYEGFDSKNRQPYVLSCPHIICSDCLDNVNVVSERQNNDRNYDQNHSSKICPECNGPVTTTLRKGYLRA